jgi:hypothetical protein
MDAHGRPLFWRHRFTVSFHIPTEERCYLPILFDEDHLQGSTAVGFKSDTSGAGIQVEKRTSINPGAEDIKQRFLHSAQGGPNL